jgi:hypothetical protein
MKDSSLINQYETFRGSVVGAINSLDVDEAQRQVFMIALQAFYLQMLRQIPNDLPTISGELIYPDVMN